MIFRYGILKETKINLSNIASIDVTDRDFELDLNTAKMALIENFESHNFILNLHAEVNLTSLYGSTKKIKVIAFHVDDKEKFRRKVEAKIN